jgi:hypothetical protein
LTSAHSQQPSFEVADHARALKAQSLLGSASQELRALEAELAETVEKERATRAEIPELKRQFDEIKAKIENRLAIVAATSQQTNDLVQKIELSEKRISGLCIRYGDSSPRSSFYLSHSLSVSLSLQPPQERAIAASVFFHRGHLLPPVGLQILGRSGEGKQAEIIRRLSSASLDDTTTRGPGAISGPRRKTIVHSNLTIISPLHSMVRFVVSDSSRTLALRPSWCPPQRPLIALSRP